MVIISSIIIAVVLALSSNDISEFLIGTMGFSWKLSHIIPFVLLTTMLTILAVELWKNLKYNRVVKVATLLLVGGMLYGLHFYMDPLYSADWNKTGTEMHLGAYTGNSLVGLINEKDSSFNGVVILALPDCPHCHSAVRNFTLSKARTPDRDYIIFIHSKDSSAVDDFVNEAGGTDIPIFQVPDHESSLGFNGGRFPFFFYMKGGRVVHEWTHDQLGYPSYDWIENGLN